MRGDFFQCWFSVTPLTCSFEEALFNGLLARQDACTALQLFKVMGAFLIQSAIGHMLTKIYRFLLGHGEAGFTQPAVCAAPAYTETCSLKSLFVFIQ